jgi:HD-like signal output (HDOD) protein
MSDDTADFREVSRVLMADAAFSSQVLRLANSALLGARQEITSILQALSLIGVDRLRALVATVALKTYVGPSDDAFLLHCWRHNLATAFWSELLAESCNVDRQLGYTAGLLHDVGRIALLMLFRNDYVAFLDPAVSGDLDKLEAERMFCDADHCQIGHFLSVSWNFPPVLGDVMAYHHDLNTGEVPRPRLLVQAACMAASMSGFHAVKPQPDWEPERIEALLPPGRGVLRPSCEDLLQTIACKINQIECSLL